MMRFPSRAAALSVGFMGLCLGLPGGFAQTLPTDVLPPSGPMAPLFLLAADQPTQALEPLGPLFHGQDLAVAYQNNSYQFLWRSNQGLSPQAYSLIQILENSGQEGLDPNRYHLGVLAGMLAQERALGPQHPRTIITGLENILDLYLSDAFLQYATDIRLGRLPMGKLPVPEENEPVELDLPVLLAQATSAGPEQTLATLRSPSPQLALLAKSLNHYRNLAAAGGWPELPNGDKLEPGTSHARITLLRERLQREGFLPPDADLASQDYDPEVEQAVKAFQKRNGLLEDGVIGKRTIREMNVTAEFRVAQIILNMERLRAQPRDAAGRYIVVNIPAFRLRYFENDSEELSMKVVVGRRSRQTPVFRGLMRYLVLAPTWRVPHRLAKLDVLRDAKKDDQYLVKKGYHVYSDWSANAVEIDPCSVDWNQISKKELTYRFVQDPGNYNSLGHIKFMFPNRHSVYLHDTPSRYLFHRSERAVSSGCIRLEKPLELAVYLMHQGGTWNQEALEFGMTLKKPKSVSLPEQVPVFLVYWTAWVDSEGAIQFRNDLYGLDRKAILALEKLSESAT